MSKTSCLIEIGTEEIPARFFDAALDSIQKITAEKFEKNRIEFSDIRSFATPRRIALTVNILSPFQKSVVSETTGPPVKAAFDKNNNPTKAAEGFARSQGVAISDIDIRHTGKGDYIVVVKKIEGEEVSKVLPELIPEIISSITFPKSMRWGFHSIRFARPIRWLLCLYGNSVVKFEIDGIKSGSYSRGHRLLANKKIKIDSPADYEKILRKHAVICDHNKRKLMIENAIRKIEKKSGLRSIKDDELLETVNFLVEYPYAVKCDFPAKYLDLPSELLTTVMKDHQKYFTLMGKNGKPANSFIVISNTNSKNARIVKRGAEKVIRARFEDAGFYYSGDSKRPLSERINDLKGITFHEKIGTLYDKVMRIRAIASQICNIIDPSLVDKVVTAADLSKSDLTTGVVREFPELQGTIGYYYALKDRLPNDVAVAIREHYKPAGTGDSIPSSDVGKIVSIADKTDSVVSFFNAGIMPTGSEDPYALRRQAQGIVHILMSAEYPFSLRDLLHIASGQYSPISKQIISNLESFFMQRVEFALISAGIKDDTVAGILHESLTLPLHILFRKAGTISSFRNLPDYNDFLLAIKRINNILPEFPPDSVDPDLFTTDAELSLYTLLTRVSDEVRKFSDSNDFSSAFSRMLILIDKINTFFDKVLIMDRDEKIKNNRLAILKQIWDTAMSICNFSRLREN